MVLVDGYSRGHRAPCERCCCLWCLIKDTHLQRDQLSAIDGFAVINQNNSSDFTFNPWIAEAKGGLMDGDGDSKEYHRGCCKIQETLSFYLCSFFLTKPGTSPRCAPHPLHMGK